MMSGHATIDTAVEATRFGALEFLEKPVAMARLLTAVRAGLERGRVMRNVRAAVVPAIVEPVRTVVEPAAPAAVASETNGAARHNGVALDQPLRDARDEFERVYFEFHLARENYSMTRVADRAGLERTHLYRKLKQLGIELARGARRGERPPEEAPPQPITVRLEPPVYAPRDEYDD
jgi:DNA-binding NtrC family response regulator